MKKIFKIVPALFILSLHFINSINKQERTKERTKVILYVEA